MERWERDAIDRRLDRVEEAGRKAEDRFRRIEWRDGMRIHLNVVVLLWILMAALVIFEIAAIAIKR
jgi:hypothetical protein